MSGCLLRVINVTIVFEICKFYHSDNFHHNYQFSNNLSTILRINKTIYVGYSSTKSYQKISYNQSIVKVIIFDYIDKLSSL